MDNQITDKEKVTADNEGAGRSSQRQTAENQEMLILDEQSEAAHASKKRPSEKPSSQENLDKKRPKKDGEGPPIGPVRNEKLQGDLMKQAGLDAEEDEFAGLLNLEIPSGPTTLGFFQPYNDTARPKVIIKQAASTPKERHEENEAIKQMGLHNLNLMRQASDAYVIGADSNPAFLKERAKQREWAEEMDGVVRHDTSNRLKNDALFRQLATKSRLQTQAAAKWDKVADGGAHEDVVDAGVQDVVDRFQTYADKQMADDEEIDQFEVQQAINLAVQPHLKHMTGDERDQLFKDCKYFELYYFSKLIFCCRPGPHQRRQALPLRFRGRIGPARPVP